MGFPFPPHTGHSKRPGKSVLNMSPHNPIQSAYNHIGGLSFLKFHERRSSCLCGLIVRTLHLGLSQAELRESPYNHLSAQIPLPFFLQSSQLFTVPSLIAGTSIHLTSSLVSSLVLPGIVPTCTFPFHSSRRPSIYCFTQTYTHLAALQSATRQLLHGHSILSSTCSAIINPFGTSSSSLNYPYPRPCKLFSPFKLTSI